MSLMVNDFVIDFKHPLFYLCLRSCKLDIIPKRVLSGLLGL